MILKISVLLLFTVTISYSAPVYTSLEVTLKKRNPESFRLYEASDVNYLEYKIDGTAVKTRVIPKELSRKWKQIIRDIKMSRVDKEESNCQDTIKVSQVVAKIEKSSVLCMTRRPLKERQKLVALFKEVQNISFYR